MELISEKIRPAGTPTKNLVGSKGKILCRWVIEAFWVWSTFSHARTHTFSLWGLNRYWLCQTLLSSSPTLSEDPSLPVDCCLSKQPELHMDQFPLKQPSWHCVSAPWNTVLFSVLLKIVLCSHTQNSEMRRHNQPGQREPFPPRQRTRRAARLRGNVNVMSYYWRLNSCDLCVCFHACSESVLLHTINTQTAENWYRIHKTVIQ